MFFFFFFTFIYFDCIFIKKKKIMTFFIFTDREKLVSVSQMHKYTHMDMRNRAYTTYVLTVYVLVQ